MYPLKTIVKYIPDKLAESCNTFTTVYLGNYMPGNFDEDVGSHLGVDIFPMVTQDTVFACLDGVIQVAENKSANGNYVIIQHNNVPDPADTTKRTTLYSCYLHLSEYTVTVGQTVSEGDIIGKCGNTGNVSGSTGEHLHFQIDRQEAPFHPYWPFSFAEAQAAGLGFFEAVNKGLGRENARKYTINPLVYLDKIQVLDMTNDAPDTISISVEKPLVSVVRGEGKPSVITSSERFSDVSLDHPYTIAIHFLKSKNIASGNGGIFFPEASITRAELLKMVFGASGTALSVNAPNYFSDIDPTSWQAPYANTAKIKKIIGGYSDGTFKPDNSITRAESFKIIINTFYSEALDTVSFPVFDDVPTDMWYASYANFAKMNELIRFTENTFEPNKLMNRGEVAHAIYTLLRT